MVDQMVSQNQRRTKSMLRNHGRQTEQTPVTSEQIYGSKNDIQDSQAKNQSYNDYTQEFEH